MPAYKGTKVLGTLRGGFHPKGTAPVAGMTGTRGPRTTDPKMVNKPSMGSDRETYISATRSKKAPPQPTAAERAASRKQDESLKKAKVTKQEGKVIESANRSEGSGMKKGGEMKMKKMMADKAGRAMTKKSADTMGRAMVKKAGGGKCYAKGGSVSSRADGVAKKGKTHTKMVAMKKGGKC